MSAFIGRGGWVPDRIVRAGRTGRVELIVSTALLGELADVLARPKFGHAARGGRADDFIGALRVAATVVDDVAREEAITRDPKDDYLVRLARASSAVLISGDGDLLEAGLTDVEVLTPRAFIDRIESAQP